MPWRRQGAERRAEPPPLPPIVWPAEGTPASRQPLQTTICRRPCIVVLGDRERLPADLIQSYCVRTNTY
jgi:hypothetical protein